MPNEETPQDVVRINPGYVTFRIAKALRTSEKHADPAVRERARKKAEQWAGVLDDILHKRISIGARQPMPNVPIWATPEVLTGGFATGQLLAGGPLLPHEAELLARVGGSSAGSERQTLNAYYLSDAGLAELTKMLCSGCYEIKVPEEGALLVVAWLLTNGRTELARNLVDQLLPYFATLRFYPAPTERSSNFSGRVRLETVGSVAERLGRIRPNRQIIVQREAISIWAPFYDRVAALFLETVEGEMPSIQPDAEGRWVSPDTGKFAVAGGWPCRRYAGDWRERAAQLLSEFEQLRSVYHCRKAKKEGSGLTRLLDYLNDVPVTQSPLLGAM